MMKPTGTERDVVVNSSCTHCVALGKLLNFSRSQFLYQEDGDDDNNGSVQSELF